MGATVTTGKLAAAFRATSGCVFYVLYEETYEKNCHPHTPEWSCWCFGPIERVMNRIFSSASSCEGGMLQTRNGYITPEGYIASWLKILAEPIEFMDRSILLKYGTAFYDSVNTQNVDDAIGALTEFGRQNLVADLSAGKSVSLEMYDDAELIAALLERARISAWRILRSCSTPLFGLINRDLGYTPAPVKEFEVTVPRFLKIDGDNRLVQGDDGIWRCRGWEYSIVGQYVSSLVESELREPGSYRKRIKAFRDGIKSAPRIPEGTKVVVDLTIPLEREHSQRAVQAFPETFPVTRTATGYEVAVTLDDDLLWKLTHLPEECTSWVIPDQDATQSDQFKLFAA